MRTYTIGMNFRHNLSYILEFNIDMKNAEFLRPLLLAMFLIKHLNIHFLERKIACGGEMAIRIIRDSKRNKFWSRKCNSTIFSFKVGIRHAE